jgi:dextranase
VTSLRVHRFGPARPWSPPRSTIAVEAELSAPTTSFVDLTVELLDVDRVVGLSGRRVRVGPDARRRTIQIELPSSERHGYGLRLRLGGPGGRIVASSAIEALEGWWQSPRHAALTEFRSAARSALAAWKLGDWHVTVAQAYDWMYRHYRYEPPAGDPFVDTLGRRLSHRAVRASIRSGRARGIATLAYGSVYGAEAEYVQAHPDERVFDERGQPLSLGGTFFINDLRRGGPWRERLLGEYARAIRRFGFDGIHMDTYGPPHKAVAADGESFEFAELYPGLIAEAASRVAAARPGGRVLFNCVEGYPLEAVAPTPIAALYLELWPPDERFADIVRWVDRARSVANGRAVVIAAYAAALRTASGGHERAAAFESAVLLSCVIAAAGAYHHVLAEGDRLLVEGYYPAAVRLRPAEARELRAAWRYGARYVHLLSDPASRVVATDGLELRDASGATVPTSGLPAAGRIWVRSVRRSDGAAVLHLVDLLDQVGDLWTTGREPTRPRTGWRLRWPGVDRATAMSPWTASGDAVRLSSGPGGLPLPSFRRWLTILSG